MRRKRIHYSALMCPFVRTKRTIDHSPLFLCLAVCCFSGSSAFNGKLRGFLAFQGSQDTARCCREAFGDLFREMAGDEIWRQVSYIDCGGVCRPADGKTGNGESRSRRPFWNERACLQPSRCVGRQRLKANPQGHLAWLLPFCFLREPS